MAQKARDFTVKFLDGTKVVVRAKGKRMARARGCIQARQLDGQVDYCRKHQPHEHPDYEKRRTASESRRRRDSWWY